MTGTQEIMCYRSVSAIDNFKLIQMGISNKCKWKQIYTQFQVRACEDE